MVKRRVYRTDKTPAKGGKEYFDVKNMNEAIEMTKSLNKKAKKKNWVWA